MIKILFFIETLTGGGAEKVLCDLVNNMDQTKFDITVQTLWQSENSRKLAEGIRYKCVYGAHNRLNDLRMRIESALGSTYRIHMKDDYDIECAYLEMGSTKIIASSTNKRAKKLAWVHCDPAIQMADGIERYVKKALPRYRKYDRIICVSEDVMNSYKKLFGNVPSSMVLHNTVDDITIKEKAGRPLPSFAEKRRAVVATLGRLTKQKGYDRLLKVHKQLVEAGFEYDLWILGEGEERPCLEAFIKDNGLQDSVRLFGFQSNPYPFVKAADLLVCSSRYEGFSTFVTEGLILGKPIVTTDCTGMREILGDSEYGLITENNERALCSGLRRMLEDPDLREKYAVKAAARGEDFSARTLAAETEREFESLLPYLTVIREVPDGR